MLRAILLDLGSNYHQGTLAFAIFLDLGSNYHQCDTYIFYSISMQRLVLDWDSLNDITHDNYNQCRNIEKSKPCSN